MANLQISYATFSRIIPWILVLAALVASGCSGGGSAGSGGGVTGAPSNPEKTLSWQPPVSYADSTPLNPTTELDSFEVYVNENGYFSAAEQAYASLAAYDPGTARLTTSFNLTNLSPFLSKGVVYHVSVRAVAKNGLKSDFSPSLTFSY